MFLTITLTNKIADSEDIAAWKCHRLLKAILYTMINF